MASTNSPDKWYFTKEYLENTPSRECGFDAYKELQYRQQAANFIQDMGQKLQVSQLCINTAIVYMHRFYVFHSFTNFPWHQIASAALFLAAKVEEQPRKLEYVIRVSNICRNPRDRHFDINSEKYATQSQDLVFNENVLLQTLGFDVGIDHPHTHIVKCCHLVRASKDLAQTSYFMASNSLHLTTMCIQYKPTVVACFCILLTCKWSNWEIPLSNEKKEWFKYVDPTVTADLLEQLTSEFLVIFENCPSRLKEKIMAKQESSSSPFEHEKKLDSRSLEYKGEDHHKHRSSRPPEASTSGHRSQEQREREYKERKEKERIAHMSGITLNHQPHHYRPERPVDRPVDPNKLKSYSRPLPIGTFPAPSREVPRDATKEPVQVASTAREHAKDVYGARGDKEGPKRDSLLKSYVQTDQNSLANYADARMQRTEPGRPRNEPPKSSAKLDMLRRYEDQKASHHVKHDAENIKKHLSTSFDRSSAYLKTSSSSTSQKAKSPSSLDSKSVPRANSSSQINAPPKPQFNGNANGSYDSKPPVSHETDIKAKTDIHHIKEEIPTPAVIKRPSLFSPDQTPQHPQMPALKPEPEKSLTSLTLLSPINSPPSVPSMRNRNYSSGSEPELRPTMKKIDQVEGFENLMRDNTIGMTNVSNNDSLSAAEQQDGTHEVDVSTCNPEAPSKPAIVNGFETNPTLISNLLKEVSTASHLSTVGTVPAKQESGEPVTLPAESAEKEHRHHKSKKKKDKHKRKDKDKSKEEKEKKRKHKDKDRERSKHKERKEVEPQPTVSEPIKITIQKDKLRPFNQIKIKIPKDKIKTDGMRDSFGLAHPSSEGLKIKIPKDIITNCNASTSSLSSLDKLHSGTSSNNSSSSSNRKRERSSPSEMPPSKVHKSSHKEMKQNGRHSSSKVSKTQPSSSNSFHSSDQFDSINKIKVDNETRHSKEDVISRNNAPIEANIDSEMMRNVQRHVPNAARFNSSMMDVVSPTLLTSTSTNISPVSPILMSVKSSKNEVSRDSGLSLSVSQEGLETLNSTFINLPEGSSAAQKVPAGVDAKSLKSDTSVVPPYLQTPTTSMDTRNPPPAYNSYGINTFNTSSNFKNRQAGGSFNKHVRHSYDYPPPPPYHMKGARGSRHMNPRFQASIPPRHNRLSGMPMDNSYSQMSQNQEMHYTHLMPPQMAYNAYQVAPPTMPNVNMPPPPFGYFPSHYFEGYVMPELYQQQAATFAMGVAQPPLPTDAPPSSEAPPPPPPE